MNSQLFRLALEQIKPSDWALFEKLCSSFLASELPSLRTTASPSGDGGRDSELFSPEKNASIVIQYSVSADWKTKIRKTVKRLMESCLDAKILIYMTNLEIGAKADDLKKSMNDNGIMVDIRDRNWFLERMLSDEVRNKAADDLCNIIAIPYLENMEVSKRSSSPLTSNEAKDAALFLGLQLRDDSLEKGLSKLSYEALVRAALRRTNSENRMTRKQIYDSVLSAIPSANKENLFHNIDNALRRLNKKYIRHWQKEDEFCLSFEEVQHIFEKLAERDSEEKEFINDVDMQCSACLRDLGINETEKQLLEECVMRVIEKLLLKQGEQFVEAVLTESLNSICAFSMIDIIYEDIAMYPPPKAIIRNYPKFVEAVVKHLLVASTESTLLYLRRLSNSYTLLTFLNQTPNIQSATRKLFCHGTIWIDTSVLLPLIAEQLFEDVNMQPLTNMFASCVQAGIELRVTSGIIQEINGHMSLALTCSRLKTGEWDGRMPYLYSQYLNSGLPVGDFARWLTLFRGSERPDDDIEQFLNEVFSIVREDLDQAASAMDDRVRWALERLWTEAHISRRHRNQSQDGSTIEMLIKHDVETYLGVISLRSKEVTNELGYRNWLLTSDRIAWDIRDQLRIEFGNNRLSSPLISLSFLISNLAFGPNRTRILKENEMRLPILLDIEITNSDLPDIVQISNQVREENIGLPEYVIRRKVRDAINKVRRTQLCSSDSIRDENC